MTMKLNFHFSFVAHTLDFLDILHLPYVTFPIRFSFSYLLLRPCFLQPLMTPVILHGWKLQVH